MTFTATQIQDFAASFELPESMTDATAETIASMIVNKNGKVSGGVAKAEKIRDATGISIGAIMHIIKEGREDQRAATAPGMNVAEERVKNIFTTQDSTGRRQARRRA